MVEVLIRSLLCLARLLALLALPSAACAHRLDEYLQATIVAIEADSIRLRINLTPGVDVADRVLTRIDRDHDGAISTNEGAGYAELLRRDLTVRVDGRKLKLKLTASEFPTPDELRIGLGIIQIEFSAAPEPFVTGTHKFTMENRHLPSLSVYLINAALPKSSTIQITRQKRNENQAEGEIEFSFSPTSGRGKR